MKARTCSIRAHKSSGNASAGQIPHAWRAIFQAGIKPDEVARELAEIHAAMGTTAEIEGFAYESLDALGSSLSNRDYGIWLGLAMAAPPCVTPNRCMYFPARNRPHVPRWPITRKRSLVSIGFSI